MISFKQYILEQESIPDTITINGKERPTKNSLGKLIASDIKSIENFWKWFGDSKIVDDQGRPRVVYHGTRRSFEAFEVSNPRGAIGNKSGIYFDTDKRVAEEYAENNDGETDDKSRIISAYVKLINNSDGDIKERTERGQKQYEIVVFHPNQIKSAIENNGNFSTTSNKITEQFQ